MDNILRSTMTPVAPMSMILTTAVMLTYIWANISNLELQNILRPVSGALSTIHGHSAISLFFGFCIVLALSNFKWSNVPKILPQKFKLNPPNTDQNAEIAKLRYIIAIKNRQLTSLRSRVDEKETEITELMVQVAEYAVAATDYAILHQSMLSSSIVKVNPSCV
ncbi:hypothetical protein BKA69DRAFT_1055476 [Paraphysoderma sedebokerense]|nr:hypothetical protein BKA69DRAFT_1055476 [Paraphysoderma sedebokerense]